MFSIRAVTKLTVCTQWSHKILGVIESARADFERGKIKDGIVFFDRSFLSPAAYARGSPVEDMMFKIMREVRERNSSSVLLCRSDPYASMKSVSGRLFDARPKEKEVRILCL